MSRREDIDNAIWGDPEFELLSPSATLLYLWSWTNLRCGMAGIYKVSERAMTESKVPLEQIPAILDELAAARFAFYEDSVIWVRTRVKHLRSRSPQMATSIARDVAKIAADHPLRARFLAEYGPSPWLRKSFSDTLTDGPVTLSERPASKAKADTVTRPSTEGPGIRGLAQGTGTGSLAEDEEVEDGAGALPADYPDDLLPHLDAVYAVLRSLAERHNSKAVGRLSLASVLMGRRYKPLVRSAHDFASWADGQTQRRKDVVAGYRNWVDKADDLAGVEVLGPIGRAVRAAPSSHDRTLADKNSWKAGYPEDEAS